MGKTAFLFPGQGSQYAGMGFDLFQHSETVRSMFRRADEILGFELSKVCFQGPVERLGETVNTQPAILLVSMCCLQLLRQHGVDADVVAGHSLGEYSALVAAGVLCWEDALAIVRRRAEIMEAAFPAPAGGMAVIIGLPDETVTGICREAARVGVVEPANFNCPGQVVISGEVRAIEEVIRLAEAGGARRTLRLDVSGPFHSSLMEPAVVQLREVFAGYRFSNPRIPVVMNFTADFAGDAVKIKENLCRQLTGSVLWSRSMLRLKEYGVDRFVEVGPGRVLSGLMKRIDRSARVVRIDGLESLEKNAVLLRKEGG